MTNDDGRDKSESRVLLQVKHWSFNKDALRLKEDAEAKKLVFVVWQKHAGIQWQSKIVSGVPQDVDVVFDMTEKGLPPAEASPPAAPLLLRKVKVERAPGFQLHGWLASVCPRSFSENVLDELLATGTFMYQEKLAKGDLSGARRVRWAMRFWMLKAVFGGLVTGAFSLLGQFRRKSE